MVTHDKLSHCLRVVVPWLVIGACERECVVASEPCRIIRLSPHLCLGQRSYLQGSGCYCTSMYPLRWDCDPWVHFEQTSLGHSASSHYIPYRMPIGSLSPSPPSSPLAIPRSLTTKLCHRSPQRKQTKSSWAKSPGRVERTALQDAGQPSSCGRPRRRSAHSCM